MGLLTILKKVRQKEKEVRVLVLWGEGCEGLAPDFAPPHMAGPHAAATSDEKSSLVKKETLPASDEW